MGLPPYLGHQLAASLLFPILIYGGHVFSPTVRIARKLTVLWHKVQRWCMNCFASTQTDILAIEARIPPLDVLLSCKKRLAKLRLLCCPPPIQPCPG